MVLTQYSAPGNLNDFSSTQANAWSSIVDYWIQQQVDALRGDEVDKPIRFFNELRTPVPDNAPTKPIPWDGFPRSLKLRFSGASLWAAAKPLKSLAKRYGGRFFALTETGPQQVDFGYREQDEYCEWFETPGSEPGQIDRITFTCEGPEYWMFIADGTKALVPKEDISTLSNVVDGDRDLLVRLYRRYVSQAVQPNDLSYPYTIRFVSDDGRVSHFACKGEYNPYNKWNTTHGIMHLTHPANSLRAEIKLAADGRVPRKTTHNEAITEALKLICCSGYGAANRSSDPRIGADVNELSRQGLSVTLRDPIGLYIREVDLFALEGPNGEDVSDCWQIVDGRGAPGMILRAEFRVPEERGFRVDQVLASGEPIQYGGQIADKITMVLTGKAHDFGLPTLAAEPCQNFCCTSPSNPNLLVTLDPARGERCSELNDPTQPDKRWEETFNDLVQAALASTHSMMSAVAQPTQQIDPDTLATEHQATFEALPETPAPEALIVSEDTLAEANEKFSVGISRSS